MENNTPAAPAPAPQAPASEAPNTNINQGETNGNSGTTNQSNAPQVSQRAEIPADQVEAWNKFMEANGGFEKAFAKVKDTIANPPKKMEGAQAAEPSQTIAPQAQEVAQTQTTAPVPQVKGGISTEEFMTQQYFESLSKREEFAPIADQIRNGEVLKEMKKFGISPTINGVFNNEQVTEFLSLYSKTVPASAPSTPITTTPTAQYQEIEGEISTQEQADMVMKQGKSHPQYQAAYDFTRKRLFGEKPEPKQK